MKSAADRFWAKVDKAGDADCWNWTGCRSEGYGRFHFEGRLMPAHRWSYEDAVGPIPEGLVIDHLCRNHSCVNPAHMEPVTNAENTRRGIAADVIYARQASQTHCKNGHELSDENVYRNGRQRQCRTCRNAQKMKDHYRNRDRILARRRERYVAKKNLLNPTEGDDRD